MANVKIDLISYYEAAKVVLPVPLDIGSKYMLGHVLALWETSQEQVELGSIDELARLNQRSIDRIDVMLRLSNGDEDDMVFYGRKEAVTVLSRVLEIAWGYFDKAIDPYLNPKTYKEFLAALEGLKNKLEG